MPWNPYYEDWVAVHGETYAWRQRAPWNEPDTALELREMRGLMIHRYAFAVPCEEGLACIARYAPIVEMGAGNGYWARCLRDRGVDVVAYDEMGDQWRTYFHPAVLEEAESRLPSGSRLKVVKPAEDGTEPRLWTEVLRGGPERLTEHPDRTLVLCWPDPWSGMDQASVRAYRGDHLVYVGERGRGGPGSDGFRRLLRAQWREVERVPLPQWDRCDDQLTVYERRPRPAARQSRTGGIPTASTGRWPVGRRTRR
jgi:hypothetical protein